ncbi:MAG: hypothetical protein A3G25_03885 [Betaproteobacteria bacterium RIFCSPLOWO2_12_FULL_63_13]|nr:MAG: hypothetical protein A3H32_12065 [Betaproteobacteria bacterium RIFCSPLOWO2_02_FULL_63_19]OGA51641.1 MAG: hypothetical protein A3G25_03885 [Betaproteobacteria bacterium RIFCSPLOWO2_12_FULL_63_13]
MTVALRLLALVLSLAFASSSYAQTNELQDIGRLLKQGDRAQALERVDRYLASRPRDAQGRFLKGLILAEQNKVPEAIEIFSKLSKDYPELPEPYNNLAVLHAAQGQYEKARQALEMSIRTHPSYATAYENLGDVYTKLASQAYDKALQLDSTNSAAQTKLALVREMISGANQPPRGTASIETAKPAAVAAAPKASAAASKAAVEQKVPAKAPPAAKADEKVAAASPAASPVAKGKSRAANTEDVIKAVHAWARAWSKQDVAAYLASYARDFRTPNGEPRAAWEKLRRQRVSRPKSIEVEIEQIKVDMMDDSRATASFLQRYQSNTLKVNTDKTLVMVRSGEKWLIQQERASN